MYTQVAVIFVLIQGHFCLLEDYYWREYTGTIPRDAIVAGQDINNKDIYVGQAYVHESGLIVVEIFPGVKEVKAPFNGIHTIDSYIKILCGNRQNFHWGTSNNTHLQLELINKRPILGGHEIGGILYIGRINHEGSTKIGKIAAFKIGNANMWFNYKGKEQFANTFQVLLYNNNGLDLKIKDY